MEIQTACEVYNTSGDEPVFHHTEIVIRGKDGQFFLATIELDKTAAYTIDLEKLNKFAVDTDTVWPPYSARLLRAPTPVPQDSYIKEPSLLDYDRTPNAEPLSNLVLHEIEAHELLRKHPHPNIVDYRGCVVMAGRIKGLCLAKYKMTLRERMDESTAFDKDVCIEGIERGVRHLHSLGIVHNDINPANVMFDELDRPVIIDFDSWQREGQKLGFKGGSLDWSIQGTEYARFENDFHGLSKLREFIYNPWP
ncbi:hypothetical protein E4U19_004589 [Claviceps sp. Clav32 group G5]|nr:hypothetical protein E4U19_004589 [Claviceps sp. Clav32 group G5]